MSSVRKQIRGFKYLDSQSLTASFTGNWIETTNLDQISVMMNVICTANNGQFYVDVSNDTTLVAGVFSPSVYDTLKFSGADIPILASTNAVITAAVQLDCFSLLRIRFVAGVTHTDGTVTAYVTAKGA
jgi:hypothetical protein